MIVTVTLGNDDVYEIEEYFSGLLETTDPAVQLFNDIANAAIVDDDSEYLACSLASEISDTFI